VLMLAGAGLGAVRTRGFARFWLGTFIVALLWALGGFTPFYHLVYALVPGSKFFRAPSTIFYIVSFCVALFAAFGVERIAAREVGPRYLVGWLIAGVLIAIIAAAGGFTNVGEAIADPSRAAAVEANAPAVTLGALRSLLFVVLASAVLFALLKGKLGLRAAASALVLLIAVDLWTIDRHYWGSSPPAAQVYAPNAITDYIAGANREEQGRVLTYPVPEAPAAPMDPFLTGDALMVNDIRMVTGYHGNELGRYQKLNGIVSGPHAQLQRTMGNPNFARLSNMKYVLSNLDSLPIPGYSLLAGPVQDGVGTPLYLYSVPGDNPPAWVTPVIVKAPDDAVLATILD
ncbi:MAG TPA: hypothetical protein VIQ60_12875, partial [Gemmatimonadaceae bacterium]